MKNDVKIKTDTLNEEERLIVERGLEAQERFRAAPEVFLSEDTHDENAELVRMYAPECLDKFDSNGKLIKRAAKRPFFADRKELAKRAAMGYVPVLGDEGKFVANSGGDVLCWSDRNIFDAREARRQRESSDTVRAAQKDLSKDKVAGSPDSDVRDLRDVELKVKNEVIDL